MTPVSAAVLGAGTMGAQLAAHLANAGVSVVLFDLSVSRATAALGALARLTPPPLFIPGLAAGIVPASFDDLSPLASADWVLEAVVEDLDAKQSLLSRASRWLAGHAVLTSNTSGIPLRELAASLPEPLRARWLGTHFFNPPRYLHLVELIPTPDTDPAVLAAMAGWLDRGFGKGVVVARDRPGFIGNRIGMFAALRALEAMTTLGLDVEDVDALTGPVVGFPKSATFRTLDLAGLDVVLQVARDLERRLGDAGRDYRPPALLSSLVDAGAIGDKAGRGFYERRKTTDGAREVLAIDPQTLTWRPRRAAAVTGLASVAALPDVVSRVRALMASDTIAGAFTRETLGRTLDYVADIADEIAYSADDVDRAMRWGLGWDVGPFALRDALGLEPRPSRTAGRAVPVASPIVAPTLPRFRDPARRVVKKNPGATLVDLGEGVLGLDLHSKMNTIGSDALAIIRAGVDAAARGFQALVIGSDADLFSAGANLTLLLIEAQDGNWEEVDRMVREFQRTTRAIAHAPVPVVVAARGLCLGGGCEIALHADRVQAGAELYIGLVETSVGLIPAGGGSKELLRRSQPRPGIDASDTLRRAFEIALTARVSSSAREAVHLGYLREVDGVTMNPDRVLDDACALARERADGYVPPPAVDRLAVGGPEAFARLSAAVQEAQRTGRVSDHDALVAHTLAWVLTGGDVTAPATLTVDQLLDLEREAFLSLCGERKTRDRIAHTLRTGTPLRN